MSNDLHTLSGAYALDALSPEEAAEFRTHLEVCAACRQEVRELREAASMMGASEALAAPARLRDRVLQAADRTPQLAPRTVPVATRAPSRWAPRLLSTAAAVVLILGGIIGVRTLVDQDPALGPAATQVFQADDVRTAEVDTNHGRVRVAASPSRDEMAVDTSGLVSLGTDEVYQLWTIVGGTPQSVGVLEDPADGAAMPMPPAGAEVAITVEPAGGSEQPTSEAIVQLDPAGI